MSSKFQQGDVVRIVKLRFGVQSEMVGLTGTVVQVADNLYVVVLSGSSRILSFYADELEKVSK